MATYVWPDPVAVVEDFYTTHLRLPESLWRYIQPTEKGSRRPKGPRRQLWAAAIVLAAASLEAGLEEIVLAAHGHRLGRTGTAVTRDVRKDLVENTLMTPGRSKIDALLLSQFGLELDVLPASALFEARFKAWAKGGSGRGAARQSPKKWSDLGEYLDALMHIRHGTAHADHAKLASPPTTAQGYLWLTPQSGGWSIQQPHALTGLRTVVAVFNTVADALDQHIQIFNGASPLKSPDVLFKYEK